MHMVAVVIEMKEDDILFRSSTLGTITIALQELVDQGGFLKDDFLLQKKGRPLGSDAVHGTAVGATNTANGGCTCNVELQWIPTF